MSWRAQRLIVAELHGLEAEVDALNRLQTESRRSLHPTLATLIPSMLDKAFNGELT